MATSFELTDQKVTKCRDSQRNWKQRLLHGIFRKRVSSSTKVDLDVTSHPAEGQVITRPKSNLTWKRRFLCCISSQTDD